ncbi:BspA family leucine-rich repeat surface protein [Flavobacteriaceae bacterium]|nr:BspA family leucine-rich repeat surface protein [Flavobacteriaceae bacterium]
MKKVFTYLSLLLILTCAKEDSQSPDNATGNMVPKYILTASAGEGGSVAPATGSFNAGTQVSITATASSGYTFSSWSNGSTANPVSVTLNTNTSITANFEVLINSYTLTVTSQEGGSVSSEGGEYNEGTEVTLTATANQFYQFQNWSGDLNSEEESITLTIDSGKTLTANFIKVDDDEDGVLNVNDACENTNSSAALVSSSGCEVEIFYLADNAITIKAIEDAEIGMEQEFEGNLYEVVSEEELRQMIADGDDLTYIVTSKVTDMHLMFQGESSFNQPIGNWDVSNVTSMRSMFSGATSFNGDLSDWDVSSVNTMQYMFDGATSFNGDLSDWDVSNVTKMKGMFALASVFNQPIGNWDVSNVTDMQNMFIGATSFNGDISNWDVSNVTTMQAMFSSSPFNQDISNWDVSNVTNMNSMFTATNNFNQDINNWDVSNVTDMSSMFRNSSFNKPIGDWDVSNVTDMSRMFQSSSFNKPIGDWDVSNVSNCSTFDINSNTNWADSNKPNFTSCNPD